MCTTYKECLYICNRKPYKYTNYILRRKEFKYKIKKRAAHGNNGRRI